MEPPLLLTDLVPRRPRTYVAIALAGVASVAVLDRLYWASLTWAPSTRDGSVAAFDLDAEGTIGSWFSSAILFLAGQVTLVIRHLKKIETREQAAHAQQPAQAVAITHPRDARSAAILESLDVHSSSSAPAVSRRRTLIPLLWLCVAAVWFLMSLDESGSLHEGWKELAARLLGTRIHGDGSILWAAPYFVVLSLVGCFILLQARSSRPSVALLFSAGGFYALAVAAQMGLILKDLGAREVMFEESAEMLGDLSILLCMLTYARHIILHRESGDSEVFGPYPLAKAIDFARRGGLAFRGE